jgi:hypothetical protein
MTKGNQENPRKTTYVAEGAANSYDSNSDEELDFEKELKAMKKDIKETKKYCTNLVYETEDQIMQKMKKKVNKTNQAHKKQIQKLHNYVYWLTCIIVFIAAAFTAAQWLNSKWNKSKFQVHYNDIVKMKSLRNDCMLNLPSEYATSPTPKAILCSHFRNDNDYWEIISETETTSGPVRLGALVSIRHHLTNKFLTVDSQTKSKTIGNQVMYQDRRDERSKFRIISADLRGDLLHSGIAIEIIHEATKKRLYNERWSYKKEQAQLDEVTAEFKTDLDAMWIISEIKDRYHHE